MEDKKIKDEIVQLLSLPNHFEIGKKDKFFIIKDIDLSAQTLLELLKKYPIWFEKCRFETLVLEKMELNNPIVFADCEFSGKVSFKGTKFFQYISFKESTFLDEVDFSDTRFFEEAIFSDTRFLHQLSKESVRTSVKFNNSKFAKRAVFSKSYFGQDVYFHRCIFYEEFQIYRARFDSVANFYFTTFEKVPNFSACVFEKPKLANFVGVDLSKIEKRDIEQYISKKAEAESKLEENKEKKRTQEELSIQHSRNIKDSFRVIKDVLLTQNNKLEAQIWHKLELYTKEVEIEYLLEDAKQYKKQDSKKVGLIFDKCILGFYRFISEHHNDFGKILNATVSIIVFHSIFIFMLKYLLFTKLFSLEEYEDSFVALLLIPFFLLPIIIVVMIIYFFLKKHFTSGLFFRIAFYLFIVSFALYFFAFVSIKKDPSSLHYLVFSIVCVYCSILSIVFLIPKNFLARIVLYASFSCIFLTNPEVINPSLGIFKENPLNNTILKHYVEENDFAKIQNFLRNCNWFKEKLDSRINDYYSLQEVLSQNSRTFLRICGKEQANANKEKKDNEESKDNIENNKFELILMKNEFFNQTLACINVIYLIMLILCIFSLQKTARKNSIIPS